MWVRNASLMLVLGATLLLGGALARPAPADSSLISWWPASNSAQDVISGNNGVLQSGTTYGPAVFGTGFHFDGVDDRIFLGDPTSLALTHSITVSAWVFVESLPPAGPTEGVILFRGDDRDGLDPYVLGVLPGGAVRFHVASLTDYSEIDAPIPVGQWLHVAGTLDDATGIQRVYINGQVAVETTTTVRPFKDLQPGIPGGVGIGNHPGFPGTRFNYPFHGTIDELKVFDRALTAAEIQADANVSLNTSLVVTGFDSQTVVRFDGSSGTVGGALANEDLVKPAGTVFGPDGKLYVSSLEKDRVLRFNAVTGAFIDTFVAPGSGGLDGPEALAFGPGGDLLVVSRYTGQVLRYNGQTGAYVGVFAEGGGMTEPFDMTFGPDGNLYVSSRGTASVLRFNGQTGAFMDEFIPAHAQGLQLDEPRGVLFGPDNNFYVVSPRTDRVLRFNGQTGAYIDDFVASGAGGIDEPCCIRFGADGRLYVSSATQNDVKRYDSAGQFLDVFAAGGGLEDATFLSFSPAVGRNRAPFANAGADQQVEWDGSSGVVLLNGSASFDPDGDTLNYTWTEGAQSLGTGPALVVGLGLGVHTITLTVQDTGGLSTQATTKVTVVDNVLNRPPTPTGLAVTAPSSTTLKLTWSEPAANANNTPQNIRVERKAGANFQEIASLAPGTLTYTDQTLAVNTGQTYRLREWNTSGFSPATAEVSGLTLPVTPTGVSVTAGGPGRLDVAWTDPNPGKANARLERSADGGQSYGFVANIPAGTNSRQDLNLQPSTNYLYRLRCENASGNSAFTSPAGASTWPLAPAAPTNLRVTARTQTSLRLEWNQPGGQSGFRIERKNGVTWQTAGTTLPNVLLLDIGGLQADTAYSFRVIAFNIAGDSPPSSELQDRTLPVPPGAPGNFSAVAETHAQVRLTWSDDTGETSYRIERKLNNAPDFTPLATPNADETTYTDSDLTELTLCTYRLVAVNPGGESPPAEAAARTLPQPPDNVSGQIRVRQIAVSWSDHSSGESGFSIQRKVNAGGFQFLATLPANTTNYLDSNLTPSSAYTYRVQAIGPGGDPLSLPADSPAYLVPANVAGAKLAVSPKSLDFGTVKTGVTTKAKPVTLKNTGSAAMTVFVTDPDSPFHAASGQGLFTLNPKASRKVLLQLTGVNPGKVTGALPIATTASANASLSVPLKGKVK